MAKMFIGNKDLADELQKRFMFIEKAYQQILVGNYGIAKKLLTKVMYDPMKIAVVDDKGNGEE